MDAQEAAHRATELKLREDIAQLQHEKAVLKRKLDTDIASLDEEWSNSLADVIRIGRQEHHKVMVAVEKEAARYEEKLAQLRAELEHEQASRQHLQSENERLRASLKCLGASEAS
ncbi:unnamed protein product [Peniophora sp. CBMAI 1063]|nr:unnamed protein product [Peniophora sp. CBMAI 1063]